MMGEENEFFALEMEDIIFERTRKSCERSTGALRGDAVSSSMGG
jgi:hypothetical protein